MTTETTQQPSELEALKKIADNMGIPYKNNIGLEALKKKVEDERAKVEINKNPTATTPQRQKLINEATKLVRCQVVCMNPAKRTIKSEIITVANDIVGTLRKLVVFNVDYHLPQFMVDVLLEKKHRHSYEVFDQKLQRKVRKNKFVNSYGITVLPQLTEAELKELAVDQRKREFNSEDE